MSGTNNNNAYNEQGLKIIYYNMMLDDWKLAFLQTGCNLTNTNYSFYPDGLFHVHSGISIQCQEILSQVGPHMNRWIEYMQSPFNQKLSKPQQMQHPMSHWRQLPFQMALES